MAAIVAKAGAKKGKGEAEIKKPRFGRVKANLKMGILGLPNVGKSSFFNLLTDQEAEAANFPFCTIEPNKSRCAVPDQRFDWLCDLFKPPSTKPPFLWVTDIAGLIRGASEGLAWAMHFCRTSRLLTVSSTWYELLTIPR